MPIINLPQDNRWGALGSGIGGVLTGVLNASNDAELGKQVGEIIGDTALAEDKKPARILEKLGRRGLELYDTLQQGQARNAQIKNLLADVGHKTVVTALDAAKLKNAPAMSDAALNQAQANVPFTNARTVNTLADANQANVSAARVAALTGPEVNATNALTPLRQAQAGNTLSESQLNAAKARQEENRLRAQEGVLNNPEGIDASLDLQLQPFGLKPNEIAAARNIYKGELLQGRDPSKPMMDYAKGIAERRDKQASQPTPEPAMKQAIDDVKHGDSALKFIDAFAKGGYKQVGAFSGATIKSWLESKGIPTGDPEFVKMYTDQTQQIASAATTGGGFFSAGRVKLAHDVTPNISGSPLHVLLAADSVADRQIEGLTARLQGYSNTQINTKPIEQALAKWQDVKKITGSFQSDVIPNPQKPDDPAAGRTVAYFQGNQIDPKSFDVLVSPEKKYPVGRNQEVSGTTLFDAARKTGKDPYQVLQELKQRLSRSG